MEVFLVLYFMNPYTNQISMSSTRVQNKEIAIMRKNEIESSSTYINYNPTKQFRVEIVTKEN